MIDRIKNIANRYMIAIAITITLGAMMFAAVDMEIERDSANHHAATRKAFFEAMKASQCVEPAKGQEKQTRPTEPSFRSDLPAMHLAEYPQPQSE